MARKKTISQDDINRICTSIVSLGEIPTLTTVRERLGGTGSFATIQPLLKNWKETSRENADLPPTPEKMEEIASYAASECWKFTVKLNRRENANLKGLYKKDLKESNDQIKDSLKLLDKTTAKNEKLTISNQKLLKEIKTLENKYSRSLGRIEEIEKAWDRNEPKLPIFQEKEGS